MLISRLLAWIAVLAAVVLITKFAARLLATKNRRFASLNRYLHNIHIPCGIIMLIAATAHGILAGNFSDTKLADIEFAPLLWTLNAGTVTWIATILLAVIYLFRKTLKKHWMDAHRILTVLLIVVCIVHIATTGIGIHTALASAFQPAPQTGAPASPAPSAAEPTATPAEHTAVPSASSEILFAGVSLRDGIYTGTADGYHGPITVEVTVSDGQVTAVDVIEQNESERYFSRALAVIDGILSQQTWEVDAVSGATYSSEGITDAVKNALEATKQ